jgi:hypothetical protein
MSSIYDRFKPTNLNSIKDRKKEVIQITNEYENNNSGDYVKRMRIKDDGTYKIRVWPAHTPDALSVEPKVTYFVPCLRKKKDGSGNFMKDSSGKEIWEPSVRPVFDARVHGGAKHDLVDTYITLAKAQAALLYPDDTEKQKTYLAPVNGNKFQGGQYMGIGAIRAFLFYGELYKGDTDEKEFYEFEVGKAIDKGMQKTAAVENANDPLGTDGCFTDPLEGRPMRIVVDSQAGKLDPGAWYSVAIVTEMQKENIGGRMVSTVKEYPLSEEDLEKFEKDVPPLINYRTIFSRKDLDIQLKGLEMFDAEHKFNILETDEFKDVYNYLDNLFPVVEDDNNQTSESPSGTANSASEDEFDLMDLAELKDYIKENNLGITILPRYTDTDLRELIRETEATMDNAPTAEEEATAVADEDNNIPENVVEDNSETQKATGKDKSVWANRVKGLQSKVS